MVTARKAAPHRFALLHGPDGAGVLERHTPTDDGIEVWRPYLAGLPVEKAAEIVRALNAGERGTQ